MAARILIVKGFLEGRTFNIPNGGTLSIGRSADNTLQILEQTLSRRHCQIAVDATGTTTTIRDLGSSYGTCVNDERIRERQLADGDRISLGGESVALEFYCAGGRTAIGASTDEFVHSSTEEIEVPERVVLDDEESDDLLVIHEEGNLGDAATGKPAAAQACQGDTTAFPAGPTLGLATTGQHDPWIGKTLSGYEIRERLGEGSVGVVYRAVQPRMSRTVALKMLQLDQAAGPSGIEKFLRGARISGQFQHPNIVALYDAGQAHGCYYLAMEFVEGESVGSRLNRTGPLPIDACVHITEQVVDALVVIHEAGVIHQDIKPDSILVTSDDDAKLADLGIAAEMRRTGTLSEQVRLAPHYLAPEQLLNPEDIDHRADLYSLGATLYKMLTGRAPFSAGSTVALIEAIQEGNPTAVNELRADVPPSLAQIVHKLLSRAPEARHNSVADLRSDLGAAIA